MNTTTDNLYATVQVDFIRSREIPRFRTVRDRKLRLASDLHLDRDWILAPYVVTAWDEFQTIVREPARVAPVLADLRWIFHPEGLRIGIGLGSLDRLPEPGEAVNVGASGASLELAREALETLKAPRKYEYRTAIRTDVGELERSVGLALRLRDSLVERATDRQRETMRGMWRLDSQERVADRLGIDESTVSRTLRRGGWWEIQDVDQTVAALLAVVGDSGPDDRPGPDGPGPADDPHAEG